MIFGTIPLDEFEREPLIILPHLPEKVQEALTGDRVLRLDLEDGRAGTLHRHMGLEGSGLGFSVAYLGFWSTGYGHARFDALSDKALVENLLTVLAQGGIPRPKGISKATLKRFSVAWKLRLEVYLNYPPDESATMRWKPNPVRGTLIPINHWFSGPPMIPLDTRFVRLMREYHNQNAKGWGIETLRDNLYQLESVTDPVAQAYLDQWVSSTYHKLKAQGRI